MVGVGNQKDGGKRDSNLLRVMGVCRIHLIGASVHVVVLISGG